MSENELIVQMSLYTVCDDVDMRHI